MNRIFHARIAWYQYFLLAVLTVNAVGALWCKYILPAVLFMLMLIVVIEQIIHTAYTVTTNGNIEISRGRFIRKKVIPISEITTIQRYRSMKFGSFSVTDYILIEYGKDKFASVMPVKEREFVELIERTWRRDFSLSDHAETVLSAAFICYHQLIEKKMN